MKDYQAEFAVEKMCKVFCVSRSAYYAWLSRKPSKRAFGNQVLKAAIQELHQQTKSRLGSPKMRIELKDRGILVSRPRVARLMKQLGLRSIICNKFKVSTTDSNHGPL
ncbi:IS3 family transposase [Algoriphagus sp. Y33]|uniref:IS3 family transposase n=1 Tax=Algoriphagus sp. Y33 TaxID=2772483 RepID=UPI001781147E|nr:IS3 family transposase [Algoriphagus sp. Y33]